MASPPLAYTNPPAADTRKNANPFSVLEEVQASDLPYRLRNTLAAMLRFNRFGNELYPATLKIRIQAGCSYRTAQRHIDSLVDRKILEQIYPANVYIRGRGFRRSATYKLNREALVPRVTVEEYMRSKENGERSVTPIRPRPVQSVRPETSAASPAKPLTDTLTDRQISRLRRRMQQIMRKFERQKEAAVGSGDQSLTFAAVVRQACDDELIEFALAWPAVQKMWDENHQEFLKSNGNA